MCNRLFEIDLIPKPLGGGYLIAFRYGRKIKVKVRDAVPHLPLVLNIGDQLNNPRFALPSNWDDIDPELDEREFLALPAEPMVSPSCTDGQCDDRGNRFNRAGEIVEIFVVHI